MSSIKRSPRATPPTSAQVLQWLAARPWATVVWVLLAQSAISGASYLAAVHTRFPLFNADALLIAIVPMAGALIAAFSVVMSACVIVSELYGYKYLVFSVPELTNNLPYFPRALQAAVGAAAVAALAWLLFVCWHARARGRREKGGKLAIALIIALVTCVGIEQVSGLDTAGSSYLKVRDQLYFFARELARSDVDHAFVKLPPTDANQAVADALAKRQDIVLVLVESFGEFKEPAVQSQLDNILFDPSLQQTHAVHKTLHAFQGSTIHGEFRELCNAELHSLFFSKSPEDCWPARMQAAGYHTSSFHGNDGRFYRRNTWYPTIGLQEIQDLSKLPNRDTAHCGGVWNAYCDLDLLQHAAVQRSSSPRFDYVLTVNTHLPAEPMTRGVTHLRDCRPRFPSDVCTHLENTERVLHGIVDLVRQRSHALIVVAGDHAPPFVLQSTKRLFDEQSVPVYILAPK